MIGINTFENEAFNILETCFSSQMTLYYDVIYDPLFVYRNGHYFINRTTKKLSSRETKIC